MSVLLTIGDFSRMTYLSVKALRHYHDIGLLEPAAVDPASGYRLYQPDQVATAQVIRRLRDLDMPLDAVRTVLRAPDLDARNTAIVEHLHGMERRLEQLSSTVTSLRVLLERPSVPIEVEYRSATPVHVLAITGRVSMADSYAWLDQAQEEISAALTALDVRRTGPDGALYFNDFFENDAGNVTAFVPITGSVSTPGRIQAVELPAVELAVTVHHGTSAQIDRTYGALGTYVAQRAVGVTGPIREHYLITSADTDVEHRHRTEVCWPVFRTGQ
ncbi:MerR family transcriptional regulator [Pseudonocardia spinosispora]|uniref:MerR family transcriptional regulator n=1 Tax=Pseudonocardia spinosispora TaxID=103441 RepID=UPI0004912BFE|nr:MerR family transcriptional regulator [Pseudonocardia spinosispora]